MDVARLHTLGWHHTTGLEEGIAAPGSRCRIGFCGILKSSPLRALTKVMYLFLLLLFAHLTFSSPSLCLPRKWDYLRSVALP